MKQLKLNSKRNSSGQVVVLLIIVLLLLFGAWWWLYSQRQASAKEGTAFAKEAIQKIAVQHDINFFNSRLSPQARMNFPASTQQEFMNEIMKLGAPIRPVDVQGKIEFQSQFFEPHGSFHTRIYYPARYADMDLTISHPVGRWQIDEITFIPQQLAAAPPPVGAAPPPAPAPPVPATSPAPESSPAVETSPPAETSPAPETSPATSSPPPGA
jgi:hypothetical protein